jgi:hypothetical protein
LNEERHVLAGKLRRRFKDWFENRRDRKTESPLTLSG